MSWEELKQIADYIKYSALSMDKMSRNVMMLRINELYDLFDYISRASFSCHDKEKIKVLARLESITRNFRDCILVKLAMNN